MGISEFGYDVGGIEIKDVKGGLGNVLGSEGVAGSGP